MIAVAFGWGLLSALLLPLSLPLSVDSLYASCPGDFDGDGTVSIDELITAVNNSLHGCPVPEERFVDNGDGTITDTATGLMWERKVPGTGCLHCVEDRMDWYTAMSDWISAVNGVLATPQMPERQSGLGGHTDWRLPTLAELRTLPACVQCPRLIFGSNERCSRPFYWSSTTNAGSIATAQSLDLGYGTVIGDDKDSPLCVRAVRRSNTP